jgi:hypothetical protein
MWTLPLLLYSTKSKAVDPSLTNLEGDYLHGSLLLYFLLPDILQEILVPDMMQQHLPPATMMSLLLPSIPVHLDILLSDQQQIPDLFSLMLLKFHAKSVVSSII